MRRQSFVGIYWTRPVPWAGFVTLPANADEAAARSLTIRYQRDLARRYVRNERGCMVNEIAILELAPDRASPEGAAAVTHLVAKAPRESIFLTIDFSQKLGWRPHRFLWANLPHEHMLQLLPEPILIDGVVFDPIRHFRNWVSLDDEHKGDKDSHRARICAALADSPGSSWKEMARQLNAADLTTHGGRSWTADNLRKFMANARLAMAGKVE